MKPAACRPRSAIRPLVGQRPVLSAAQWLCAMFPLCAVLCTVLLTVFLLGPASADQSPTPAGLSDAIEQAIAAVRAETSGDSGKTEGNPIHDAVVRIITIAPDGLKLGSGSLVAISKDYGLVLTNWHVVGQANDEVLVVFSGGYRSTAKVLKTDSMWDLAALAIDRPPVAPLRISRRIPAPDDPLRIAGYGDGSYRCVEGRCTQFVGPAPDQPFEMVELSVAPRHGDSGGPILNARGEIAGILFGATDGCTTGSHCGRVAMFLKEVMPDFNSLPARPLTQVATASVAAQPKPESTSRPPPFSTAEPETASEPETGAEPETAIDDSPSPAESPPPESPAMMERTSDQPAPETASSSSGGSEKSPPTQPIPDGTPWHSPTTSEFTLPGDPSRLSPEEDEVGTPLWRQSLRRFLNRPVGTVCWDLLAILGILTISRSVARMMIRDRRHRRQRYTDTAISSTTAELHRDDD